jgi:hypothetical protein
MTKAYRSNVCFFDDINSWRKSDRCSASRPSGSKEMRAKYLLVAVTLMACRTRVSSQETLRGTLDYDRITAGEHFPLHISFPEAPTYAGNLQVYFRFKATNTVTPQNRPNDIVCTGKTGAGLKEEDLDCSIPIDQAGGTYEYVEFDLGPPPNGSQWRHLKLSVPDIEVIPIEDKNVYPTSAVATISLPQRQLLTSGASKFGTLLDQLNTRVEDHSAETAELKAYLLGVATTGKSELGKIREQYRRLLSKDTKEPIFFEDFDRQFDDYIAGLRAPKSASVKDQSGESAHLQFVQLAKQETVIVHPSSTDDSLGPFVGNLTALLANVRDGLKQIADSQSDTFTISLKSTPPGATISYKRLCEPYQDYSSPTDVEKATFPYAMWTFRFTVKDCCIIKKPNPYIEKSPNLDPPMNECLKVAECSAK